MDVLDKAMEQAQKAARDRDAGQHGLFGIFEEASPAASAADRLPNVPDWEESVRLANEKEILGFWISGHPLEKYQEKIEDLHAIKTSDVLAMKSSTAKNEDISVGGLITGVRIAKTRKGDLMAGLVIEDMHGRVEAAVFPEAYKRSAGEGEAGDSGAGEGGGAGGGRRRAQAVHQRHHSAGRGEGKAATLAADFDSTAGGTAGDGGRAAWAVHAARRAMPRYCSTWCVRANTSW